MAAGMMEMASSQMMRQGSYLINASRGTVVNIEALAEVIKTKHLVARPLMYFLKNRKAIQTRFALRSRV